MPRFFGSGLRSSGVMISESVPLWALLWKTSVAVLECEPLAKRSSAAEAGVFLRALRGFLLRMMCIPMSAYT